MRPSSQIALLLAGLAALAACEPRVEKTPGPSGDEQITVRLEREPGGQLASCNSDGVCETVSNPGGCAVLELIVATSTGSTCERCMDDAGAIVSERCDADAGISCTVITAPEPDCVVCASSAGEVIASTCVAAAPDACVLHPRPTPGSSSAATCASDVDCPTGTVCDGNTADAPGVCVPVCRVCYDANGRVIVDECAADCRQLACPSVACAPGFRRVRPPGECCDQCVPETQCSQVVCSGELNVPDCPQGTDLVRDPADCCRYWCEPTQCATGPTDSGGVPDSSNIGCPAGFRWEDAFPACGQCIPEDPPKRCLDLTECSGEEICTNALGECLPPPGCDPTSEACFTVCYGLCQIQPAECRAVDVADIPCEGRWETNGIGPDGCPLAPVCICPDGIVSVNGRCADRCDGTACAAAPKCGDKEILSFAYPYCCGICVPNEACVSGDAASPTCPAPNCGPGFHPELGADCCELCVRNEEPCQADEMCHIGEFCTTSVGVCNRSPDCANDGTCNTDECWGVCRPEVVCEDSDGGLHPNVAGMVTLVRRGERLEPLRDTCTAGGGVEEYGCLDGSLTSTQQRWGSSVFACEFGCADGACRPRP